MFKVDNTVNKLVFQAWLLGETNLMIPKLENVLEMLYILNPTDSFTHINSISKNMSY